MSWHVRVQQTNYGEQAVVFVVRSRWTRFHQYGVRVTLLDLTAPDAEDQLAEARAKAKSMARQLRALETP